MIKDEQENNLIRFVLSEYQKKVYLVNIKKGVLSEYQKEELRISP